MAAMNADTCLNMTSPQRLTSRRTRVTGTNITTRGNIMENQHRKISGYRELRPEEIDLMNKIKAIEIQAYELILEMEQAPFTPNNDAPDGTNQPLARWVEIGKVDIQKGLMALVRSVAKPVI